MNYPPSSSDEPNRSTSFDLLAEPIQRWIWRMRWKALRDIQEHSIPAILNGERDLIIAAATASGKTEAAFLPLLSRVLTSPPEKRGFALLYVSPLKALINDQFRRLDELCEAIEIPVHRWHGDVSASAKAKARKSPSGVLLITPESLEALFVRRGLEIPGLFSSLYCVVIDEVHTMFDTERGTHLRSLLNRLEIAIGRQVRRLGLSATLGDMELASIYLRPDRADAVDILISKADLGEIKLQLRGYKIEGRATKSDNDDAVDTDSVAAKEAAEVASDRAIAQHLFATLRGSQNLIFAGSRQRVELFADILREMCEHAALPNEFYAHHANLARDHREFVEHRLKAGELPTSAVCTSTLELGIDIGAVESVAQIGCPFSVASMRQRLGRSGRRENTASIMRLYIQEKGLNSKIHPFDELRLQVCQSVAMVDLLLEGWCEPPKPVALHLSTLVHQVLSVIAERNGIAAAELFHILCERGPFSRVDRGLFIQVLRRLGSNEIRLIEQSPDGTLLLGIGGERIVEHYEFYSVFMTPEEYRIIVDGRTLGTLPIEFALAPNMTIVFSGRRWRILEIDDRQKVISVTPDRTGRPPKFGGDASDLHDTVAEKMKTVLSEDSAPRYLDEMARHLLAEGRAAFQRYELSCCASIIAGASSTILFTWRGTVATQSLAMALVAQGLSATPKQIAIEIANSHDDVVAALRELSSGAIPDSLDLAGHMKNLTREKFHPYLDEALLEEDAASSRIDAAIVPVLAARMAERM